MKGFVFNFGDFLPSWILHKARIASVIGASILLPGCVWLPLNSGSHEESNFYNVSAICQVQPGDTLESVAAEYCTTPRELAAHNKLQTNATLRAGQTLRIPPRQLASHEEKNSFRSTSQSSMADAARLLGRREDVCERPTRVAMEVPKSARNGGESARGGRAMDSGRVPVNFVSYEVCARPGQASTNGMCWPVIGRVSRPYHMETNHRGIDILAAEGTPVVAAKAGKVAYAGDQLSGFGNMIIIDHGGDFATIYAHNRRNLVKVGQQVRRGQTIAEVGQTGNASAPHCHFEVRQKAKPMDPRPLLP